MKIVVDSMTLPFARVNFAEVEVSSPDSLSISLEGVGEKLELKKDGSNWILFAPPSVKVIQDGVLAFPPKPPESGHEGQPYA